MTSYVEGIVGQLASVITTEGRVFAGILVSFDQSMNIILKDCIEKIYSMEEGVKFENMGLYMIRGDNVVIVTEVDQTAESQMNYTNVIGEKIKEIKTH